MVGDETAVTGGNSPMSASPGLLGRGRRALTYLRLRPFDLSTEEGRAAERYRRAAWSTVASVAARLLALVVSLVTLPLAVGYLGVERYGIWVTISAFTAMLAFADLGLGNGLMNAVADGSGRDDRVAVRGAVSSAFFILTPVALVAAVGFALIYGIVPWAALVNASSPIAAAEAGPTMLVFFLCLAVSLPLGLVQRIQYGYQEGFAASLWVALGSIIGLVGLIGAIQAGAGLPWLVLAVMGGPVLATAINGVILFSGRHADLRPRARFASRRIAFRLLRVGFLFFVLQIAVAVAYQSDIVVAARILGPSAAAEYSVALRLFFLAPTLLSLAFLPLWPAYGEAIARGDLAWVRATLVRSTVIAILVTVASSSVLLLAGREVLRIWVGPVFDPPFMMLLGMALWAVVSSAFMSIAMLLNGATVLRFQVVVASVMAAVSIAASIALATRFGISGVIWGTLLAYLACAALPYTWYVPRVLRRLEADAATANASQPGAGG